MTSPQTTNHRARSCVGVSSSSGSPQEGRGLARDSRRRRVRQRRPGCSARPHDAAGTRSISGRSCSSATRWRKLSSNR